MLVRLTVVHVSCYVYWYWWKFEAVFLKFLIPLFLLQLYVSWRDILVDTTMLMWRRIGTICLTLRLNRNLLASTKTASSNPSRKNLRNQCSTNYTSPIPLPYQIKFSDWSTTYLRREWTVHLSPLTDLGSISYGFNNGWKSSNHCLLCYCWWFSFHGCPLLHTQHSSPEFLT